jgi:subtilisin family serine protease
LHEKRSPTRQTLRSAEDTHGEQGPNRNVNPDPAIETLIQDSAASNAQVMNTSWAARGSGGDGYGALSRVIDLGVRDPNPGTAALEHLAIVCAAGNAGGQLADVEGRRRVSIGGHSWNCRHLLSWTCGRWPTAAHRGGARHRRLQRAFADGHFRAPIAGTGVPDPMNPGQIVDGYVFMTGTSQACPHVSGAFAVVTEWRRNRTGGKNPSRPC